MSDLLSIKCPQCSFSFPAEESHIGLSTACANCGSEFIIQLSTDQNAPTGAMHLRPEQIPVTSGNIASPYDIIGMVCFVAGTRGEMRAQFDSLKTSMSHRLAAMKSQGQVSKAGGVGQVIGGVGIDSSGDFSLSGFYAGASFQSNDLEIAFHIAINQLQLRAKYLGGNAVLGFRYDIDFDSNVGVLNFMATAYGTAVKMKTD